MMMKESLIMNNLRCLTGFFMHLCYTKSLNYLSYGSRKYCSIKILTILVNDFQ